MLGNSLQAGYKCPVDNDNGDGTDKAKLFGHDSKDRVVGSLRRISIGLDAVTQAKTQNTARTDRNQGLAGLIASGLTVLFRMQECRYPFASIGARRHGDYDQ